MGNPALVLFGALFSGSVSLWPTLHWRCAWALGRRCGPRAGAGDVVLLIVYLSIRHLGIVLALRALPFILPASAESVWVTPFRPPCRLRSSRHCFVRGCQRRGGAEEDFFDVNNRCACSLRVLVVGALGVGLESLAMRGNTSAFAGGRAHINGLRRCVIAC